MAKRATGIEKRKTVRNHKTAKRLSIKKAMLEEKANKGKNKKKK